MKTDMCETTVCQCFSKLPWVDGAARCVRKSRTKEATTTATFTAVAAQRTACMFEFSKMAALMTSIESCICLQVQHVSCRTKG